MNISKALSWDELATLYDEETGEIARIRPMDAIWEWAENQTDKFIVSEEGTIHKIINN